MNTTVKSRRSLIHISWWLLVMCGLIFVMTLVGGATRLTDSGLSITEWKPVTGAIPPLTQADWLAEFEKYKQIPEYQQINYAMSLDAFKEIYWWEWSHRFLGRLIGLAFAVPLLFFAVTRQVSWRLGGALCGLLVLGGAQGFLGWYMVQSGLSQRVDVSQYRLAAHLGLAILLFALMAFLAFELRARARAQSPAETEVITKPLRIGILVLTLGIFLQMVLGAFVAGLRAGHTFNDWPLMDGRFVPEGYFSAPARVLDLFESIAAVQFNHRIGAYLLVMGAGWFFLKARHTRLHREARWILAAVLAQGVLGIVTLISYTPLSLGLAHQGGAMMVLFLAVFTLHRAVRP